jgi:hypothetical protein
MNCNCKFPIKRGRKKRSCTDGRTKDDIYFIWSDMIHRCYNKKSSSYPRYGGRGIKVCDKWQKDFLNFKSDMKGRKNIKLSLDRKDNSKNYCPHNCRWATPKQQASNRHVPKTLPNYRLPKTGVRFVKFSGKKFIVQAKINYKMVYFGTFKTLKEAAKASKKVLKRKENYL